ncbi:hypothetical protein FZW96_06670 [Bacillus sp. BGMRC 2118]|nr:hypothetical protein FZW96_06670 [Bacillus sp. BGMRC 2118]
MEFVLTRSNFVEFVQITITYRELCEGVWITEKKSFHTQLDADSFMFDLYQDKTKKLVHFEKKTSSYEEQVPAE